MKDHVSVCTHMLLHIPKGYHGIHEWTNGDKHDGHSGWKDSRLTVTLLGIVLIGISFRYKGGECDHETHYQLDISRIEIVI